MSPNLSAAADVQRIAIGKGGLTPGQTRADMH